MGTQGGGGNTDLDFMHTHKAACWGGIFLLHVFPRQCRATPLGGTAGQGL